MTDLRANDFMWLRAAAMSQPGFAAGFAWSAATPVFDRLERAGLVQVEWVQIGFERDGTPRMRAQAITTPKGLHEIERRARFNVNRMGGRDAAG